MANDGHALTWESEVENDGQYTLLPEGEAEFEVVEFKRGHNNSNNCPQAELKVKVISAEGMTTISENLPLHSKFEWKLCEFFRAIGQRQHGERLKPNWSKLVGARGRCVINVREYEKDGQKKQINGIKKYHDPDAPKAAGSEPSF